MVVMQSVFTAVSPASGANLDMFFISVLNIIDGGGCMESDGFITTFLLSLRIAFLIEKFYIAGTFNVLKCHSFAQ